MSGGIFLHGANARQRRWWATHFSVSPCDVRFSTEEPAAWMADLDADGFFVNPCSKSSSRVRI